MTIWITTDTHFNHNPQMQEYCGRPENHEELIFKGLSQIPKQDVLIHLGDVCIGDDANQHEKYIVPLKCKKWLIKGNHDKKSNKWYLEHGWDFVGYHLRDKYFRKKVLFSHIPVADDGSFDVNIHGHFHNSDHRRREPELMELYCEKHLLVALENMDYRSISLKKLLS